MLRLKTTVEGSERSYPLATNEVRIGRGGDNEIVLSDFSVSRRHAALRREADGWFIYDMMSTNGVQLNQEAVKKAAVRSGDRLKIGIFELQLEGEDDAVKPITATTTSPSAPAKPAPPPAQPSVLPAAANAISNATIVRPLSDFSLDFGLASKDAEMRAGQAQAARPGVRQQDLRLPHQARPDADQGRLGRRRADAGDGHRLRGAAGRPRLHPAARRRARRRDLSASWRASRIASSCGRRARCRSRKTMLETVMNQRVALLTYDALVRPAAGRRRVDPHPPDPLPRCARRCGRARTSSASCRWTRPSTPAPSTSRTSTF